MYSLIYNTSSRVTDVYWQVRGVSAEQSAVRDAEREDTGPAVRGAGNTVHGHEDSGAELVRSGQ